MYLRNKTNNTFNKFCAACAVALIGLCAAVSTARADTTFTAVLSGLSEVPMNGSTAVGRGSVVLNTAETQVTYKLEFSGLSSNQTDAHVHAPAERDANAGVLFSIGSSGMTSGSFTGTAAVTPEQAAQVSVGGRVTTADGRGIRGAFVTITGANGNSRTVLTGKLGAYRFTEVSAGETYIINVRAKRFTFASPTQVRTITEDLTDVDFAANEQSSTTFD